MGNSYGTATAQNEKRIEFWMDADHLEQLDLVCKLNDRTRAQMLRLAVRQVLLDKGRRAQETALELPPTFELLTLREAQQFLAPYYNGKPPSTATLERRIVEGILIATQDYKSRTAPQRILKASLVRWMARLGKELEEQML